MRHMAMGRRTWDRPSSGQLGQAMGMATEVAGEWGAAWVMETTLVVATGIRAGRAWVAALATAVEGGAMATTTGAAQEAEVATATEVMAKVMVAATATVAEAEVAPAVMATPVPPSRSG